MIMDRRSFLRNGGLFGALLGAAGAPAVMAASSKTVPLPTVKEDISHLAPPDNAHTLQLCGSYPEAKTDGNERMRVGSDGSVGIGVSSSQYQFYSTPPTTHSVTMTVGKDNRLWIKVGDKWQRVALES